MSELTQSIADHINAMSDDDKLTSNECNYPLEIDLSDPHDSVATVLVRFDHSTLIYVVRCEFENHTLHFTQEEIKQLTKLID